LTTALGEDELVTEIFLPALPPRAGWGFEEFALRSGDFAFAAVVAILTAANGKIGEARVAVMGSMKPAAAARGRAKPRRAALYRQIGWCRRSAGACQCAAVQRPASIGRLSPPSRCRADRARA